MVHLELEKFRVYETFLICLRRKFYASHVIIRNCGQRLDAIRVRNVFIKNLYVYISSVKAKLKVLESTKPLKVRSA